MSSEIENEKILGVAIKGNIKEEDGTLTDFYYKLKSPAVHSDLRSRFYSEHGVFLPEPPRLTSEPWEERFITVTYGFFSENEEFLTRRQAARIAFVCGQIPHSVELLTSDDLNSNVRIARDSAKKVSVYGSGIANSVGGKTKRWSKPGRLKK